MRVCSSFLFRQGTGQLLPPHNAPQLSPLALPTSPAALFVAYAGQATAAVAAAQAAVTANPSTPNQDALTAALHAHADLMASSYECPGYDALALGLNCAQVSERLLTRLPLLPGVLLVTTRMYY